MDEHGICGAYTGKKVTELKRSAADYWFIYVARGKAEIIARGETYCAAPGQVAVICLMEEDVRIKAARGYESYILQVEDTGTSEALQRYLMLMNFPKGSVNIITTGAQQDNIRQIFQDIVMEKALETQTSAETLNLLWRELLVRLYRVRPKAAARDRAGSIRIVSAVRKRLEKEYHRDLDLKTIAAQHRISVSYLSHIFKENMGVSLLRYLLECRVKAAGEFLTKTAMPISEVAKKSGFHDCSNFSRTFKRETGYSPRQYRKKQHE